MAMHNSEFDKNLDFSREFAEEIYPCPWSIFKCPSGSGKFSKISLVRCAPSGKFSKISRCPREISKIALGLG